MKLITASPAASGRRSWRRSLASVLVVALGASGGFSLGVGCHREPQPTIVEPGPSSDEPPPPLPPASGTPIGFLVDEARLKLSDDQLAKLKDIDADLAGKLGELDSIQRGVDNADQAPPPQPSRSTSTTGVSAERTGDGNGTGAGRTTAPHQGRIKNPDRVPGPDAAPATKEQLDRTRKRLPEYRASDVREAIRQALALLNREQQKIARDVLKDRGVDPDTGRFEAVGVPGVTRGSDDGSGSASGSSHFGRRDR